MEGAPVVKKVKAGIKGNRKSHQSLLKDGNPVKTRFCTGVMISNFMSCNAFSSIGSNLPSIAL